MPGRSTNEPANYIAFAFQADQTTAGTTFNFLRHLDGSGADIDEQVESVREGGDGQEIGLRYKTAISWDGAMVHNARPEVSARLDAATFGADTVSAPAAGEAAASISNLHTAVPTSFLPYMTVEQLWADVIERGIGAQITEMAVEFEQGRPMKVTHQFLTGGTISRRPVASALTPTRETGQPFMYPNASVIFEGAGASGPNVLMTKGKITVKRNLDGDIRTLGLNRQDVVGQTLDVMVEGTLKYESASTMYDPVHYNVGGSQIPFDLATGAFRITSRFGSGTLIRLKEYGVNAFHYTQARVNKLDPEGKTMYIDFAGEGYKSATHQAYAKTLVASVGAFF